MEAQAALAFVARREAMTAMPASRWAHVMGLELRWMSPGEARAYIEACTSAGLLRADGDDLRLSFDPKAVDVPRGFRPDPHRLPERAPEASAEAPATPEAEAPDAVAGDVFSTWLPKVAAARGEDVGETLAAVEAGQTAMQGLHADVVLLRLGAEAGLDVRDAAAQALKALRA